MRILQRRGFFFNSMDNWPCLVFCNQNVTCRSLSGEDRLDVEKCIGLLRGSGRMRKQGARWGLTGKLTAANPNV